MTQPPSTFSILITLHDEIWNDKHVPLYTRVSVCGQLWRALIYIHWMETPSTTGKDTNG